MISQNKLILLNMIMFAGASFALVAGPKRTFDEFNNDVTDENQMEIIETEITLEPVAQKTHTTNRKEEENHLLEEYRAISARRAELNDLREQRNYVEDDETIRIANEIKQALENYEFNSATLRLEWEFNALLDLKNKNWDTDPYWNSIN